MPEKKPPICPARLILFCVNLFAGLVLSQLIPEWIDPEIYMTYKSVIKVVTMFHLSYIMINVGFEFEIDKSRLRSYGKDYLVAMTAASFPWILVSLYFIFGLGPDHNVPWRMALVSGRFAAPTSAGILFTMLEAAGMKETWLFKKARILAIFDDLDTLLLMVPLKAIVVGFKWELSIDLVWVVLLLVIMYKWLHKVDIPATWYAIATYAALLTCLCEAVHLVTSHPEIDQDSLVETIHLEILLPAFTIGCIVKNPHGAHAVRDGSLKLTHQSTFAKIKGMKQESVKFYVSAIFMVLVGLSMPSLFNDSASAAAAAHRRALVDDNSTLGFAAAHDSAHGSTSAPHMPVGSLVLHVFVCSVLMNVGKMFPACCYRSEVPLRTRLALSIGMMPRGEVCAGIIVNAIALGANGVSITIAVLCLAINMSCVSGFIFAAKHLAGGPDGNTNKCPPSHEHIKSREVPSSAL